MHLSRLICSAFLLVVLPAAYSPAGAGAAIGVAMDDFSYTDTSAEPANQTAAHERRLSAFMAALRRDISADGRYRPVPSAQDGAAFKVIGGIQKTSTLVQWAKVAVIDVGAKRLVMDKLYTFRGDNDESWERAEIFVSREVMAALSTPGAGRAGGVRFRARGHDRSFGGRLGRFGCVIPGRGHRQRA
ncbi:hypothetical protein ACVJDU_004700 [Bradyrhizobium diazoefficiens]